MGVDNFCLSLSIHSFLALQILSVGNYKRGTYDVTFFFPGAFFGIAASAAVACNPSIAHGQNEYAEKRTRRATREVLE
jgi:hypothetical protein